MQSPLAQSLMSPGAILRATWNLYRRHWLVWLGLCLVIYLPVLLTKQVLTFSMGLFNPSIARNVAPIVYDGYFLWVGLASVFSFGGIIVIGGVGAIFASDSLRGERPSVLYALDLFFGRRLWRAILATLLVVAISAITYAYTTSNILPEATSLWLVDALPWMAGLSLLIAVVAAIALTATGRSRHVPLLLAVILAAVYAFATLGEPAQPAEVRSFLAIGHQAMLTFLTALFLLILPAAVLDSGPLRQAIGRGWAIAKKNLPLIFIGIFLLRWGVDLIDLLTQAIRITLPDIISSGQWINLGLGLVDSSYANYLLYEILRSLVFVLVVSVPLQALFAAVVTLNGYRQLEKDEELITEDSELEADRNKSAIPVTEAEVQSDAEPEAPSMDDNAEATSRSLLGYTELALLLVWFVVSIILTYGVSLFRGVYITWLNQLIR